MHLPANTGHVALVGAGPGDPELITLKGMRLLEKATVILFDALIPSELLNHNPSALKVYVGKRAGAHSMKQSEINQLLVGLASRGEQVVRLKGGDPMVFGRAAEELAFVKKYGIPVEVVPGISAYSGVAASYQIPITQRGSAEGIWIATGTTRSGALSEDILLAARSSATVIVYMGFSRLAEIVEVFKAHKAPEYPAAVVQNGTLPFCSSVFGTLNDIVELASEASIAAPALLLFGYAILDRKGTRNDREETVF